MKFSWALLLLWSLSHLHFRRAPVRLAVLSLTPCPFSFSGPGEGCCLCLRITSLGQSTSLPVRKLRYGHEHYRSYWGASLGLISFFAAQFCLAHNWFVVDYQVPDIVFKIEVLYLIRAEHFNGIYSNVNMYNCFVSWFLKIKNHPHCFRHDEMKLEFLSYLLG